MCGLAGYVSPERMFNCSVLETFCDGLAHRGPDARGIWQSEDQTCGFAHTRLSIIDPDSQSNQPMTRDGYTIVFNGAIYNYPELRDELKTLGHHFKTQGDTEVLLYAYKQWGAACLQRLNGMFAFAVWDERRKALFMARDRMGQKPLFYRMLDDGGIAFASEPSVLASLPNITAHENKEAVPSFLALGYTTGADTVWHDIKRMPPAHFGVFERGEDFKTRQYWSLLPQFENRIDVCEAEASAHLQALIDDAVKIRMRADVSYGAFLSGGIDSNTVAASMNTRAENIRTFTIGFDDARYNESDRAQQSAAHFKTNHHTFTFDNNAQDSARNIMTREPLADVSIAPMMQLAHHAREHVKMVLTGDGGDEVFGGYPTYIANAYHRMLSPYIPFMPKLPMPIRRRSAYFKLYKFLNALPLDAARAHFSWRVFNAHKAWEQDMNWEAIYAPFYKHYNDAKHLTPLAAAQYVDMKTFLPDCVLAKTDRATMAHGLEARSPLLDHRIASYAASLPDSFKLKRKGLSFQGKHILRQSQRDRLPAFLYTQAKRGFSVPSSFLADAGRFADTAHMAFHRAIVSDWKTSYL